MKFFYFFILLFLSVILCASFVDSFAMSLGPAGKTFEFFPGLEIKEQYGVFNKETDEFRYQVMLGGDLSQYASAEPESFQGPQKFWVTLKLPLEIEPGPHILKICVRELPNSAGAINTISTGCTGFTVRELYPGKYLKWDEFYVSETDMTSEDIVFNFELGNWGKERILSAYGKVYLLDDNNNTIREAATNIVPVESAQDLNLQALMSMEGIVPGDYQAEGTVFWDEGEETKRTSFTVGSAIIKVSEIYDNFTAGEINPVIITIKNGFKGKVDYVHLTLTPLDGSNINLDTPNFSLRPFEDKNVTLYLDARNYNPGPQPVRIKISHEGEVVYEKEFILNFKEPEKPSKFWFYFLIGMGVVVVVLANILIIRFLTKRNKYNLVPPNNQNEKQI